MASLNEMGRVQCETHNETKNGTNSQGVVYFPFSHLETFRGIRTMINA